MHQRTVADVLFFSYLVFSCGGRATFLYGTVVVDMHLGSPTLVAERSPRGSLTALFVREVGGAEAGECLLT